MPEGRSGCCRPIGVMLSQRTVGEIGHKEPSVSPGFCQQRRSAVNRAGCPPSLSRQLSLSPPDRRDIAQRSRALEWRVCRKSQVDSPNLWRRMPRLRAFPVCQAPSASQGASLHVGVAAQPTSARSVRTSDFTNRHALSHTEVAKYTRSTRGERMSAALHQQADRFRNATAYRHRLFKLRKRE